ncbi:TonB-dependent receptor [Sphingobium sp. EM0848]|uniref:TonB-dependent receptor n=1 Tax=Sphingobium sp. EM0848 TaxID=2743473 RepID=UPI0021018D13|nr:TonB-dependent receptor [Sphingobium sp. EM0848]
MKMSVAKKFYASALAGSALSAALLSTTAWADTVDTTVAAAASADAVDVEGLGAIVVTAEKRQTNLQDTPIAIAVMSDQDLANRHVQSLEDLGDGSIPSLRIAPFFSRKSALTLGIRGVGALGDANQPARDQGVGVYVDGVYLGRAQGLGAALFDVQQIEVLKGPQGTLFGRNTEGGAVSITTRKPSGEFHLNATAGISNYGGYEGIIHLDLPSFHNFSVKLDGLVERRGGTVDNPMAGQPDFNGFDRRGVHAAVKWEPAPNFTALYSFDKSYDATTPYYVQLFSKGSLALAPIIKLQPDRATIANVGVPMEKSVGKTWGHQLNLDWDVADNLKLRSISSYRDLNQSQYDNGSTVLSVYAPNANFSRYSIAHFDQYQYSEELQAIGEFPEVTYVAGLFYYHEHVSDDAWAPNTLKFNADGTGYTVLSSPVASTPFPDRASTAVTDNFSAFGQFTWTPSALNDRVHLTAGGRYSHDKKQGHLYLVNGATPTVNGVTAPLPLDLKADRFDPLVTLAFDVTPKINIYGKWSTGYKAGGANSRSLTYRAFGPESVSSFEIGSKMDLLSDTVRLNLAAYTTQYKNVQIDFNAVIPGANRGTLETTNTDGNGRIKGVEADLTVAPTKGLTLSASYAYTDVRLPPAPNPFVTGNPLVAVYPVYVPKHSSSGAIDYELPVAGGDARIVAHLDANFASRQYGSANDKTLSDRTFLVNGRLSLADIDLGDHDAKLRVSVWARNLLDHQFAFLRSTSSALGVYGIYNEPRTFGGEINVQF